ncbi:YbgC/FadM family acyl-CoA thioesterase [Alphaproteobacteria bacterium]|nr:YbgC/FadM family acyl-CoA thioesterase [Alphaproteobacteria bacterium]
MFQYTFKIYYEDTDSGGVVYYANYLKFIERARAEMINELGFTLTTLLKDYDRLFLVKKIECDYVESCKLEDRLNAQSRVLVLKNASFELEQNLLKENKIIFRSKILMVCVNSQGAPSKIPNDLHSLMKNKDG